MNADEMNWLSQTIEGLETEKRFVQASTSSEEFPIS
jgi:hypothetical protein